MRNRAFIPGALVVAAAMVAVALMPAEAGAETTTCSAPPISEPFLAFGDTTFYSPVPGEGFDSFSATGWTLGGGAQTVASRQYDGLQGSSLDLPSKATAVSPQACVNNSYPYARMMARGFGGAVKITVSYATQSGWTTPAPAGEVKTPTASWRPSSRLSVAVGPSSGWHPARFTFTNNGAGDAQLYNFYVDPRMR